MEILNNPQIGQYLVTGFGIFLCIFGVIYLFVVKDKQENPH